MFDKNCISKFALVSVLALSTSGTALKSVCKNKILCVGGVTCDVFIDIDKKNKGYLNLIDEGKHCSYIAFHEGNKIDVSSLRQYSGGGAGNAAVSFKLLGLDSSIFCKVGEDSFAKAILKEFETFRVSTKFIFCDPLVNTASSFIIPSESGERTIFVNRGANTTIKIEDFPYDILKRFDGLYLTALSGKSSELVFPLLEKAKDYGLLVAFNPGISQLKPGSNCIINCLPFIDILILNEVEAAQLAESLSMQNSIDFKRCQIKSEDSLDKIPAFLLNPIYEKGSKIFYLSDLITTIIGCGTKIVLVTDGAEGAFVGTKEKIYFHPIIPVKVFNTIGAGDAFGSTFVASVLKGLPISLAMRYATINSASVVTVEDAKSGLLTFEQIEEKSKKIGENLFTEFLLA